MEWGLAPHWVERFPYHVQKEMSMYWQWKNTRERMMQEKQEAEARLRQKGLQ